MMPLMFDMWVILCLEMWYMPYKMITQMKKKIACLLYWHNRQVDIDTVL